MTAARPLDRVRTRLSNFTLAALEDTGYYSPDYSQAEELEWGRNAGCDFLDISGPDGCSKYMANHPGSQYFCSASQLNRKSISAGHNNDVMRRQPFINRGVYCLPECVCAHCLTTIMKYMSYS